MWGVPKPAADTGRNAQGWWAGLSELWRAIREEQPLKLLRTDRVLARTMGLQLCYTMGITSLYEFAPLWMLEQAGLGSEGIAWVTALQCAAMTTASVLGGRFGGGARPRPLRDAGVMALVAATGLTALFVLPAQSGLVAIAALGVPLALYNVLMPAWLSERFAAHGQGRVMGLLSTTFFLANVIVALVGSLLALLSSRWIMLLGGLSCVAASAQLLRLAAQERSQGRRA